MLGSSWWNTIVHFVSTQGSNGLIDALAGVIASALIALIAFVIRKSTLSFSKIAQWLLAIVRKDRKYYKFEKAYLTWIINRHRYLGLLPARTVAARWGEGRRIVDLEKVYVTLQVSVQGGDQDGTEMYDRDILSWRRQPWFYLPLKHYQWISFPLLTLSVISTFLIIIFHFSSYLWSVTAFLVVLLAYSAPRHFLAKGVGK